MVGARVGRYKHYFSSSLNDRKLNNKIPCTVVDKRRASLYPMKFCLFSFFLGEMIAKIFATKKKRIPVGKCIFVGTWVSRRCLHQQPQFFFFPRMRAVFKCKSVAKFLFCKKKGGKEYPILTTDGFALFWFFFPPLFLLFRFLSLEKIIIINESSQNFFVSIFDNILSGSGVPVCKHPHLF